MKKLLSLLIVLTISGTAVPTTIAASPYQKEGKLNRIKRELSSKKITATRIDGVSRISGSYNTINVAVDNDNNVYFASNAGAYKLTPGSTTATSIGGIRRISGRYDTITIVIDNDNNVYFTSNAGAYKLTPGSTTATSIGVIPNNNIKNLKNNNIDSKGNNYFATNSGAYVTEFGSTTATRIDGVSRISGSYNTINVAVDNIDNVYFASNAGAFVIQNTYDKKIKFLGFYDKYKGEFGLDTDNKKIIFFGNNELFHPWLQEREPSRIYNKIIIKTIDDQIIKEIIINVGNSMKDVINNYNLKNGISYENGYIIEIWSHEPWRTQFFENNNWEYLTKEGSLDRTVNNLDQKFIIVNNEIMSYKFIKQHFSLLNDWIKNYDTWITEINRQEKEDVPSFTVEQKRTWKDDKKFQLRNQIYSYKQTIQILMNRENIKNLYTKVQNLENTLKNLENRIKEIENKLSANGCLNNMIDNIRDGAVAGTIGTLFGGGVLAGPIGIITGAITGLVKNITC